MLMRASELFTLSDLQQDDPANNTWFAERTRHALAGRCLLDALEYLRVDAKLPGRFWHVTNAHTIRLACRYLSDASLNRKHVLIQMARYIDKTCKQIRQGRNEAIPFFGDDFWDWASVLEAFTEVQSQFAEQIIKREVVAGELGTYYDAVKDRLADAGDLATGQEGEWPGPASAMIAHRVLSYYRDHYGGAVDDRVLQELRALALEPIKEGKYRTHDVPPHLARWHYGQVVASFPDETPEQKEALANLTPVKSLTEKADRVYALARVIEGANKANDRATFSTAVAWLYPTETLKRPLGQGLMADTIKGSLNVLEALWPTLTPANKQQIQPMIDTLSRLHIAANTIGIVVAVPREARAIEQAFAKAKRQTRPDNLTQIIEDDNYRVVVRRGKSLGDIQNAAEKLIKDHKPQWLLMSGIAGSLGLKVKKRGASYFRGPDKFHIVVAASHAPYYIREKARKETQNVAVPFEDGEWLTIPSDPDLFRLAHKAGSEQYGEAGCFHEGLIVTGRGILDSLPKKRRVLAEFPGGLAFEEESYMIALLCLHRDVPFLNIRGISDRAEGDKKRQQRNKTIERKEQFKAALAAAKLTARVVELLSERW